MSTKSPLSKPEVVGKSHFSSRETLERSNISAETISQSRKALNFFKPTDIPRSQRIIRQKAEQESSGDEEIKSSDNHELPSLMQLEASKSFTSKTPAVSRAVSPKVDQRVTFPAKVVNSPQQTSYLQVGSRPASRSALRSTTSSARSARSTSVSNRSRPSTASTLSSTVSKQQDVVLFQAQQDEPAPGRTYYNIRVAGDVSAPGYGKATLDCWPSKRLSHVVFLEIHKPSAIQATLEEFVGEDEENIRPLFVQIFGEENYNNAVESAKSFIEIAKKYHFDKKELFDKEQEAVQIAAKKAERERRDELINESEPNAKKASRPSSRQSNLSRAFSSEGKRTMNPKDIDVFPIEPIVGEKTEYGSHTGVLRISPVKSGDHYTVVRMNRK